jgi:hypothetical protein
MNPLYLVIGGELRDIGSTEFADPSKLHVVGAYADHEEAKRAWSAIARATIDDAQTRYFLIDIARLLEA